MGLAGPISISSRNFQTRNILGLIDLGILTPSPGFVHPYKLLYGVEKIMITFCSSVLRYFQLFYGKCEDNNFVLIMGILAFWN